MDMEHTDNGKPSQADKAAMVHRIDMIRAATICKQRDLQLILTDTHGLKIAETALTKKLDMQATNRKIQDADEAATLQAIHSQQRETAVTLSEARERCKDARFVLMKGQSSLVKQLNTFSGTVTPQAVAGGLVGVEPSESPAGSKRKKASTSVATIPLS